MGREARLQILRGIALDGGENEVDLRQIEICGIDCVGIGSDMDGGFGKDKLPVGFHTAADLPLFARALSEEGYSDSEIGKVCGGNLRRVLTSVM